MKKTKRFLAVILTIMCTFNILFAQTAYASEHTIETVEINGINYTYNSFVENEKYFIIITNDVDGTTDTILFDISASILYLNGEVVSIIDNPIQSQSIGTTADGWEILSKNSHYISWKEGTTAAAIAAMISVALGFLGKAGVIAAMGSAALGAIAGCSIGGTVYVETHMRSVFLSPTQYRYEWTFTDSTGTLYGPYYYHYS